jgi:hypothetical protein
MANTIKIKNSGTASAVPSSLEFGELGLNYADGKIYFKNLANTIAEFTTPPNLVIQNTAPANTSVLWADTSVIGVGVVPVGGTTGQVLSKGSNTSYDAVWANAVSSSDLALKANIASPTFTGNVSGISATMVGLGNVTNTSDANKPVSTAQQTALDLKANIATPTFTGTVTFPNVTIDGASGTISSQGVGNFKTIAGNGRGVGISGGTGDTPAILQFTNNAVGAQWGSITASSALALAINAYDGTAGSIALNASSITTSTPITGSVAQVIHTIYATNYSRTNTSGNVDITGWSMSITPKKAGNKIIILTQAALMSICDGYLYLKKNGSFLANPLISVPRTDFSNDDATFFGQYVDTAASTSAITYQFSAQATGCQGFFGVNSQGGVSSTIMIEVQS